MVLASWLRKSNRGLTDNPLDAVDSISLAGKQTFKRRALSSTEGEALLNVAGTHRPVYVLAIYTGLRRGELKQLEWRDVDLHAATPVLKARAATTKNSKDALIELHPVVVEVLRELKAQSDAAPSDRIFYGIFPKPDAFKDDLKRAGIPSEVQHGYKVDFHSFRHTFGTLLSIAGTPLQSQKASCATGTRNDVGRLHYERISADFRSDQRTPSFRGHRAGMLTPALTSFVPAGAKWGTR